MKEKDFYLEQLGKLQVEERKKVIDFLREIWDFYDENYSFAAFGTNDEKVEFLQEVFLNPLTEALDEVSAEIGVETSKQRLHCKLQEIVREKGSTEEVEVVKESEDPLPF